MRNHYITSHRLEPVADLRFILDGTVTDGVAGKRTFSLALSQGDNARIDLMTSNSDLFCFEQPGPDHCDSLS
jgi:hypothetical protein